MLNKVENIVAKGEIADHEQFHLWPQCFQNSFAANASKCVCMWKWLKQRNIQYKQNDKSQKQANIVE